MNLYNAFNDLNAWSPKSAPIIDTDKIGILVFKKGKYTKENKYVYIRPMGIRTIEDLHKAAINAYDRATIIFHRCFLALRNNTEVHLHVDPDVIDKTVELGNLSLTLCVYYEDIPGSVVPVTNKLLREVGITVDDIWKMAEENTARFEIETRSIRSFFGNIGKKPIEAISFFEEGCFLHFKNRVFFGATALYFAKDLIGKMADEHQSNILLLPFSEDFVILYPVKEGEDLTDYKQTFADLRHCVPPHRVPLSDNLYMFYHLHDQVVSDMALITY